MPDSEKYILLGEIISELNFENYSGGRTPGFSFLIAISNQNLNITIAIQIILGILGSLLFYDFVKLRLTSKIVAFWNTLFINGFVHFILYEFAILTESLTIFLMTLAFWYLEKFKLLTLRASLKHYFVLSLILSWLFFTRPVYLFIPIGLFIFVLSKCIILKQNTGLNFIKIFIIAIIPLASFYCIGSINKRNSGYFTSTTYSGLYLSQIATSFIEKAPDEDKIIRDIIIKHRDSIKPSNSDNRAMSVWFAQEELKESTKLSEQDLNYELGRISKNLFLKYPHLYLSRVFKSLISFWGYKGSLMLDHNTFNNIYFKYLILIIWKIQRYLLVVIHILFLFFSFKKLKWFFKDKPNNYDFDLFLICIVYSGAISQALLVYGPNSRFAFPFLPLIAYFVLSNLRSLEIKK
ncbi:hypothetical protein [Flavivirga spongiicola]